MHFIKFYSAFLATTVSVSGLTYLAWQEHEPHGKKTLSELAADRLKTRIEFWAILWFCGLLFVISVVGFISPRVSSPINLTAVWLLVAIPEALVAVIPAKGLYDRLHNIIAFIMGFGMFLMAILLAVSLSGSYSGLEWGIVTVMAPLGILGIVDRNRFLFYELPFIYLSHLSILVAILAVRSL